MEKTSPTLYVLVGVPGAGKSTWVKNQKWARDCVYVSTDQYVEAYAKAQGKTYSEVFEEYMPTAVDYMVRDVNDAEAVSANIIWDQTSTSKWTRAKKIRMLPDYYKIAVVFKIPDREELERRLASRPGKHIPWDVMERMIGNWEEPTLEEGFDEIWRAE